MRGFMRNFIRGFQNTLRALWWQESSLAIQTLILIKNILNNNNNKSFKIINNVI